MRNEWEKKGRMFSALYEVWANLFELINKQNCYTSFRSFKMIKKGITVPMLNFEI